MQAAATTRDAPYGTEAVPLDARALSGSICTCNLAAGTALADVREAYLSRCPAGKLPEVELSTQEPRRALPRDFGAFDFVRARSRALGDRTPPAAAGAAGAGGHVAHVEQVRARPANFTTGTTTAMHANPSELLAEAPAARLARLAAAEQADPYHVPGAGLYPACINFRPAFLRQAPVVHRPLADLCLFGHSGSGPGPLPFTVFAAGQDPLVLHAYPDWSPAAYFHAATGAFNDLPQAVQLLMPGLPGFPEPQLVLRSPVASVESAAAAYFCITSSIDGSEHFNFSCEDMALSSAA